MPEKLILEKLVELELAGRLDAAAVYSKLKDDLRTARSLLVASSSFYLLLISYVSKLGKLSLVLTPLAFTAAALTAVSLLSEQVEKQTLLLRMAEIARVKVNPRRVEARLEVLKTPEALMAILNLLMMLVILVYTLIL